MSDTINVLGIPYKVIEVSDLMGREDKWGETVVTHQEIKIWKEASPEEKQMTLLHEILHALDYAMRIFDFLDESDKERTIVQLTTGLYAVLPELLRFFEKWKKEG